MSWKKGIVLRLHCSFHPTWMLKESPWTHSTPGRSTWWRTCSRMTASGCFYLVGCMTAGYLCQKFKMDSAFSHFIQVHIYVCSKTAWMLFLLSLYYIKIGELWFFFRGIFSSWIRLAISEVNESDTKVESSSNLQSTMSAKDMGSEMKILTLYITTKGWILFTCLNWFKKNS